MEGYERCEGKHRRGALRGTGFEKVRLKDFRGSTIDLAIGRGLRGR